MRHTVFLFVAVFQSVCGFAQSSAQPVADKVGVTAQQAPDPGELITYRFRLGDTDASYSLAAVNKTDQPRSFFYKGMTPELGSQTHNSMPIRVDPGHTVTVPATDLRWPDFQYVYVEASRRIELRLVRTGDTDFVSIPLSSRDRLYDVASESRLGELDNSEFDQTLSLLGSKGDLPLLMKAHDSLPAAVARLNPKPRQDRPKMFLVIPGQSR
jgi:hypothetical protein